MERIEFKTAKEMVNWLMDNEGKQLADGYGVLATGLKTRADRRNEKAERVCREARYQMFKYGGIADNNKLSDLILEWLKYGRKICYKRP